MDEKPALPAPGMWRSTTPPGAKHSPARNVATLSPLAYLTENARLRPDAPALLGMSEQVSHSALLAQVRCIAHAVAAAAPPGRAVAVMVAPHTQTGMAAILGCIVSGRVCLPINIADPAERVAQLLEDAAPALVLTDIDTTNAGATGILPCEAPVLYLAECTGAPPPQWAPPELAADAPCMVHFTSGSTGRPKGIVLSAYAIRHRVQQCIDHLGLADGDRMLAPSGPHMGGGFALAVGALAAGGQVLTINVGTQGAGAMLRLAAREQATVLAAPPPVLRALLPLSGTPAALANLRILRMGAADLPRADIIALRTLLPTDCAIHYTYASTEAMVIAHWFVPPDLPASEANVPIGRFCPGAEYVLLDPDGSPVTTGQPGELVLRARHLALGEWQRGTLVAGRMAADPNHPGLRIFRTGDQLRVGADGLLRFAGRTDRQVKINGVRVEPAEIEAVMRGVPVVRDVAVVPGAGVHLHAFVVAPGCDPARLRQDMASRLRASLAPALRPGRITLLDELPRLPGGKIDLLALRRAAGNA